MKKRLFPFFSLFLPLCLFAQQGTVVLLNQGEMNVADGGIMYVAGDVRMSGDDVKIAHEGDTYITGNFIQSATTPVFTVTEGDTRSWMNGWTDTDGTIHFVGNNTSGVRDIRAASAAYDRATQYIAFPNLSIETDDVITLDHNIGIDANSITLGEDGGTLSPYKGYLSLKSEAVSTEVAMASLRINNANPGAVDAGAVQVNRYIQPFRRNTGENYYLYPFASPYENVVARYFTGHYVRYPQRDEEGSFYYIYGNKLGPDGVTIDASQYISNANTAFTKGAGYLVGFRPADYDFTELPNGLNEYAGEPGSLGFSDITFNGNPMGVLGSNSTNYEVLVTGDFKAPACVSTGTASRTTFVVAGNSRTSALDMQALLDYMVNTSSVSYSGDFYIYNPGYTGYRKWEYGNRTVTPIEDVDPMGVFAFGVSKTNTTAEALTLSYKFQKHTSSNRQIEFRNKSLSGSSLKFTLSPVENSYIEDRMDIVISDAKTGGIAKNINGSTTLSQMYAAKDNNTKYQFMYLDSHADSVFVNITPTLSPLMNRIKVDNVESLNTEVVWLFDNQTEEWVDLRDQNEYEFLSSPYDLEKRFTLYFTPREIKKDVTGIAGYYQNEKVHINKLDECDLGSTVSVYNLNGQLIAKDVVNNYPSFALPFQGKESVYLVQIKGSRDLIFKFVK